MQITLGQQYNVGEKPTAILYIYIVVDLTQIETYMFTALQSSSLSNRSSSTGCTVQQQQQQQQQQTF